MANYEYQCESCGEKIEVTQKFSDDSQAICQICEKSGVKSTLILKEELDHGPSGCCSGGNCAG